MESSDREGHNINYGSYIENLTNVIKILTWRCGGRASYTDHDMVRAARYQLRWKYDGHRFEVLTLDDT